MINIELLKKSMILPDYMEITTPYNGFIKYLMQGKSSADYIKSDMSKNFIFYEPINKKVFSIFSSDIKDRENIYSLWNQQVIDDKIYICQNIDFINDKHQNYIDRIFSQPNKELAIFLQNVADEIIKQNNNFEICVEVVHGEQLTNDGIRYPHAHILLRKK